MGYFHIRTSEGLDLASSLEVKIGTRSLNKKKKLGSPCTTRGKNWGKISDLGVIYEIQVAKFEVPVTYIFGGKIWGSDTNFRGKFWGQAPDILIWKYPLG